MDNLGNWHHWENKTQDEDKHNTKRNTICVLDTTIHKTQDEDKQTKYTIQYMLDTTIHKTQDEDNQNKIHNTIYVGHHYAQTSIDN
jgi:hypothetical protein